jgi:hypothetical protein
MGESAMKKLLHTLALWLTKGTVNGLEQGVVRLGY